MGKIDTGVAERLNNLGEGDLIYAIYPEMSRAYRVFSSALMRLDRELSFDTPNLVKAVRFNRYPDSDPPNWTFEVFPNGGYLGLHHLRIMSILVGESELYVGQEAIRDGMRRQGNPFPDVAQEFFDRLPIVTREPRMTGEETYGPPFVPVDVEA